MKRTRFAALVCIAIVLIAGCSQQEKATRDGATPKTGNPYSVMITSTDSTHCVATPDQQKIKAGADHVSWTAAAGSHYRVTFKKETRCQKNNSANSAPVASYDVLGGQNSDQCFGMKNPNLQDGQTTQYDYWIFDLSHGAPVQCADPAVIVEN